MKALILNSGIGSRLKKLTLDFPKCLLKINDEYTILKRQLEFLNKFNIKDVVITTGYLSQKIIDYCNELNLDINIKFVFNDKYTTTNYIYSIYLAKDYLLYEDIILMHGDLVFDDEVLSSLINNKNSCMAITSFYPIIKKDFKVRVLDDKINKISVNMFDNVFMGQPLYKINKEDWYIWLEEICNFCHLGNINVYAEEAFNNISDKCNIQPIDVEDKLCMEVDDEDDLSLVSIYFDDFSNDKKVYMAFSTDIIHGGHIKILEKASKLGKVIVGVLTDEIVSSYKRFPILDFEHRKEILSGIKYIYKIVKQDSLSYKENIYKIKPDYVVHGDDWKDNNLKYLRDETIDILNDIGKTLIEYPYSSNEEYKNLENKYKESLSVPEVRRARLKKVLSYKDIVSVIEAHNGLTAIIAEKTEIVKDGKHYQFDAIWSSSLCDSTSKGKPDIELVDMSSRFQTLNEIMEVSTKPIIFDGDTGGLIEHFVYNVKTLERIGVSAIIIEDKIGLKKNSLFGTEVEQNQDSIENFCNKIESGKRSLKTTDFMIIARVESLILEKGIDDALERAFSYVNAGADGIMIHSRRKEPDEIFEFCKRFRDKEKIAYLVVVPTTFNTVREAEFAKIGVNIVIYANHLTRSAFPAMKKTAETILYNKRAKEADEYCMSIKEILTLIPEE
ncbi:phosphoenolpyruvate mutase [uncultured Brachyspira sp.]|uniref:phosphoenolpyruvate mutase n=1 Tax=uncultured Brachyspira sp. TaxID=221953 RepID=UPI00260FD859|nr:phosphoenolpyruvate mutase [uncultured Brachyspira sp.]